MEPLAHHCIMLITCPGCASKYEVPAHLLAAGPRRLRCAGCGLDFDTPALPKASAPLVVVTPPPEQPMPPPLSAQFSQPRQAIAYDGGSAPKRQGGGVALVMAWVVSIAVLGTAGWAMVHYREPLMAAWPPSQRLFAAIGLASVSPPRP